MSRSVGEINKEAKENFVKYIFNNDYENVEAYMGYFKVYNAPEGLNFVVEINDFTPLTAACEVAARYDDYTDPLGIVKLLIKYGADPNMSNGYHTPLELAILNDSVSYELTKYLLDHGADPNIPNDEGQTPLELAIDVEADFIPQLLRDYSKYNYKTVQNLQRKVREKRTLKRNRAAKSIQTKFRNKRTLKRNRAATNIQSRRRGNLTRKRDYLSRYRSYKPWKGTEAIDYYLYTDEDIFDYLRQDDLNFVLKLPSTIEEKYEAWNVNDILKSLKIPNNRNNDNLMFYECLTPEHTLRPDNIDTGSVFIKIGSVQFIVRLPEWLYIYFVYNILVLPEPRIYTLKKYKMVNGLVSNEIYDYGGNIVSGDHCNYPKPVQTYELVIENSEDYTADYVNYLNQPFLEEEDYMANYLDMLNDYSAPSLPSNSDSSELRRRIEVLRETGNDTDDSDLIREYRRRLEDDERPVERRLFDSDQSNDYNMENLMDIHFGRRSGNLSQRQREMVENYISILEEQPTEYDPSYQPDAESDAESDDSNISW